VSVIADQARATIIVLAWNGWDDTRGCLQSLQPVASRGHRVLLVDNGSTDDTASRAREAFAGIEVISTGRNLGFAAGNNVGIRHALDRGADAVILLNNDAVVAADFADELIATARTRARVGAVTAKIYFFDTPEVLWFAGGSFSTWTGRATQEGYGQVDRGQYDQLREIGRPCGCAMLLTRACLEDMGLLDESLFLYGEEIDWALRARSRGWVGLFAPRARVWHKVSRSTDSEVEGRFYYYSVRNMLTVLSRHAPVRSPVLRRLRDSLVYASFVLGSLRSRVPFRSALREIRSGVCDYHHGVSGRRPDGGTGGPRS
jgi:GT2 family glycosyltransferase